MQDQEVYTDEKEYLHMEYEWFCIYGNNYTLLIYTQEEDSEQKIQNDFPSYKPHILKRVQDISIADTDALTGLCSAKIFFQKSKKLDENPDSQYAVVYFDLDDLKGINTRHGHLGGDAYIKAFAEVLNNHFRSYDCKVRKWWDEFVVIITDGQEYSESTLEQKIEAVQEEFSKKEILLPNTNEKINRIDAPPSVSGGYSIKMIDMDVSFDKVLHWANRMADRKKGDKWKITRFEDLIKNTDDLGTIVKVAHGLKNRVIELIQEDMNRRYRGVRWTIKKRMLKLMRTVKS